MNVDRLDSGHVEIQAVESVAGQWPNMATFYGYANIVNGVLAFGMTKVRCDGRLTCTLDLYDDQNNALPPTGQVTWAPPGAYHPDPEMQYLQFSDFPQRADGGALTGCAYRATLAYAMPQPYEVPQDAETGGEPQQAGVHEPSDPGMEISLIVYRG